MVKKQSTSKTSIQKRKDLFISVVMVLHLEKEIYKKYEDIIKSWSYSKNWSLKKQKSSDEESSVFIKPKNDLSPDNVLRFVQEVKCMLIDMQEKMSEEDLLEVDDYTNIQYLGENEENSLLVIYRFSNMMIINIMSKHFIELDKKDHELTSQIFGNYAIDGNKILNVRLMQDNRPVLIGGEGWLLFWIKFIVFSIIAIFFLGIIWGLIVGFISVVIWNVFFATIKDLWIRGN